MLLSPFESILVGERVSYQFVLLARLNPIQFVRCVMRKPKDPFPSELRKHGLDFIAQFPSSQLSACLIPEQEQQEECLSICTSPVPSRFRG